MRFQPYLISKYQTALDQELQPWLIPDDAFAEILDAYVHNGVVYKRQGYTQFATGEKDGTPYTESRIVSLVEDEAMTGTIDGANQTFTQTASNTPLARGRVTISGSNPVQTLTDDGQGALSGDGTGTVNYTTGAISVTFTTAPAAASTVTSTYSYHPGFPVMGIMNFYTNTDVRELIVADTTNVNKYNSTDNRFDDITGSALTGSQPNYISWVNYDTLNGNPRLIFTNNADFQFYNGTTVQDYNVYRQATEVTSEAFDTGDGTTGPYSGTATNTPILYGTLRISEANTGQVVTDDGDGNLVGDGTGTINYATGAISVTFTATIANTDPIVIDYWYGVSGTQITSAQQIHISQDRLVLIAPTIGGVKYPKTILISGFGGNADRFDDGAPGAGEIDIQGNTWLQGADFIKDDLIIMNRDRPYSMRYTSSDVVPFEINRLGETYGSHAPFSVKSYMEKLLYFDDDALAYTDGYTTNRIDKPIPDYIRDNINPANFNYIFADIDDPIRSYWFLHPSRSNTSNDRVLLYNTEEGGYSVYRIPLSCLGHFENKTTTTWNDLSVFDTWNEMGLRFSSWNEFDYQDDANALMGGGNNGQIWLMNRSNTLDNVLRIWSVESATKTVTCDYHNYSVGDVVYFAGTGTTLDNKQVQITSIPDRYSFVVDPVGYSIDTDTTNEGGCGKVITMELLTKKFNPFKEEDKKVVCGWINFYVSTTTTGTTDPAELLLNVITNDSPNSTVTNIQNYYKVRIENFPAQNGADAQDYHKMWTRTYINQIGRFLQFKIVNSQAFAQVEIHGMMPGFKPSGRLYF